MSLRRNTIANYLGQGYLSLIEVLVIPLYLRYLGAEAFGLVGFLALLHGWLRLLEIGLSPTLARQVAHARGAGKGYAELGRLLRSFELIYLAVAVAITVAVATASEPIARHWLGADAVGVDKAAYCIALMGAIVGLRFFRSLYTSGIRGMEDQVWLNAALSLLATARVVGALALLVFVSTDISLFFEYQVAIAGLEVVVMAARFYHSLSLKPGALPFTFHGPSLLRVAPFATSIAYTAGLWIVVSQSDKLILSAILPLSDFGYFTLVALISGGILVISDPVARAILPRLTSLFAEGRQDNLLVTYRHATQVVSVVTVSAALFIAWFAEPLVYVWTGDAEAAAWCADVLPWFALGNGILALSAFQYYLQNAFGNLRMHVIGSTLSAVIQVSAFLYAAPRYGAVGVGIAWFSVRLVWFLLWTAAVHRSLLPGMHLAWLGRDVLPSVVTGVLMVAVLSHLVAIDPSASRLDAGATLLFSGFVLLLAVALSSKFLRSLLAERFRVLAHGG